MSALAFVIVLGAAVGALAALVIPLHRGKGGTR